MLDDALRPSAPGQIGEIVIAGAGVSAGYWRDEAQTREAFLPDPRRGRPGMMYRTGHLGTRDAYGRIRFIGWRDSQSKSRGHRIELGEIEDRFAVEIPTDDFDLDSFSSVRSSVSIIPANPRDAGPIRVTGARPS